MMAAAEIYARYEGQDGENGNNPREYNGNDCTCGERKGAGTVCREDSEVGTESGGGSEARAKDAHGVPPFICVMFTPEIARDASSPFVMVKLCRTVSSRPAWRNNVDVSSQSE